MSLIGVDIHKRYCVGVIERNNMTSKRKFPNTEEGWNGFLKNEEHIDKVIIEAGSVSEKTIRFLEDLGIAVKMANPKKVRLIADRKFFSMLVRINRDGGLFISSLFSSKFLKKLCYESTMQFSSTPPPF